MIKIDLPDLQKVIQGQKGDEKETITFDIVCNGYGTPLSKSTPPFWHSPFSKNLPPPPPLLYKEYYFIYVTQVDRIKKRVIAWIN